MTGLGMMVARLPRHQTPFFPVPMACTPSAIPRHSPSRGRGPGRLPVPGACGRRRIPRTHRRPRRRAGRDRFRLQNPL